MFIIILLKSETTSKLLSTRTKKRRKKVGTVSEYCECYVLYIDVKIEEGPVKLACLPSVA